MAQLVLVAGGITPYANESRHIPEFPSDAEIESVCERVPGFFEVSSATKLSPLLFAILLMFYW